MREIKFRAWDNKTKTMFMLTHYSWMSNSNENDRFEGFLLSGYEEGMHKTLKPDVTLLQYTGLKDKHGKEIYEGDIVDVDGFEPRRYEVVFDRGGFCLKWGNDANFYPDIKYAEDSIVVGNIYENPELLK